MSGPGSTQRGGRRLARRLAAFIVAPAAVAAAVGWFAIGPDGDAAPAPAQQSTVSTVASAAVGATSTPTAHPPKISLGPGGLVSFPDAASQWVAAHPNDGRTPLIRKYIAGRPTALWLTGNESFGNLNAAVRLAKAKRGTLTLTLWNIPLRDDGLSSLSKVSPTQYRTWVHKVATRLHATRAIVILEPDALWFYDRMSSAAGRAARMKVLVYAVGELKKQAPLTRVYIDAGTASGSVTPDRMATLLGRADLRQAAGFAVNTSSYAPGSEIQGYAQQIRAELQAKGYRDPRYVIDTGRNGAASWNNDWCNPSRQRLGSAPRVVDASDGLDLDLWVKAPGTSDGDCGPAGGGAGTYGGEFMPSVAYKMITG